jgi:hypothetical protein
MAKRSATLWAALFLAGWVGMAAAAGNEPLQVSNEPLRGEVLEVKDAPPYTYLRLKTKNGEMWAAVNQSTVAKGAQVTIEDALLMKDFESRSLGRKFDRIALGTLAAGGTPAAGPASAAPAPIPGANPHTTVAAAPALGNIKVAKATGNDARTVAEIVGKRGDLRDKPVTVRGQVVKFTSGVMGKNWVHLRDGTGSANDRTDDVLVTTADDTKVGEVVTARGVVRTDKDFGAGYAYQVIVEDAKLQK